MNKKNLSASDICDEYICPAMETASWNGIDQIYRKFLLRTGRVQQHGAPVQARVAQINHLELLLRPAHPLASFVIELPMLGTCV